MAHMRPAPSRLARTTFLVGFSHQPMRFATQGTMKPVMPTLKMLPTNRALGKGMASLLASRGVPTTTPHRKTMGYSSSRTILSIFETDAPQGAPDSAPDHCSKPGVAVLAGDISGSGASD